MSNFPARSFCTVSEALASYEKCSANKCQSELKALNETAAPPTWRAVSSAQPGPTATLATPSLQPIIEINPKPPSTYVKTTHVQKSTTTTSDRKA